VEDSVYVREDRYGLGIGSALPAALIASACEAGHHVVIAEAGNTTWWPYERFGFHHVGTAPSSMPLT
jgi:L-amino acid N-acyltransferase